MSGISAINRINTTSPYLYGHIASGNRLMSAADGASDLAIVEKEKSQVTGYNTGTKNLSDGISLLNPQSGSSVHERDAEQLKPPGDSERDRTSEAGDRTRCYAEPV